MSTNPSEHYMKETKNVLRTAQVMFAAAIDYVIVDATITST